MKLFRYSKDPHRLYIGTYDTKITFFFDEKAGCITYKGRRIFYFGNW